MAGRLPGAIITDLDGTLTPSLVTALNLQDKPVFVSTWRGSDAHRHTREELSKMGLKYQGLFMRPQSSDEAPGPFKQRVLRDLQKRWTIVLAIDDDPTVCNMYRSEHIRVWEIK